MSSGSIQIAKSEARRSKVSVRNGIEYLKNNAAGGEIVDQTELCLIIHDDSFRHEDYPNFVSTSAVCLSSARY